MDDLTFKFVAHAAAVGGIIGSYVGYQKMSEEREQERVKNVEPLVPLTRTEQVTNFATDFTRTIGNMGMHTVYGMVKYPFMPMFAVGSIINRDIYGTRKTRVKSE